MRFKPFIDGVQLEAAVTLQTKRTLSIPEPVDVAIRETVELDTKGAANYLMFHFPWSSSADQEHTLITHQFWSFN